MDIQTGKITKIHEKVGLNVCKCLSRWVFGSQEDKGAPIYWSLIILSSPRAGPKGLRAESARAVTGRRNSHRWEGGRLFEPSARFFYRNSSNFGTKSRKIVSKVGN